MNKKGYYIIIFAVSIAVILLVVNAGKKVQPRPIDPRITLRKADKLPYGTHVAYHHLPYLFPDATVSTSRTKPGFWDSLSRYDDNQALIIVSPHFEASEDDMKRLIQFAKNGNDVFISSRELSRQAELMTGTKTSIYNASKLMNSKGEWENENMAIRLLSPTFPDNNIFSYPGEKFSSWFYKTDPATSTRLGEDEEGRSNFIHLKIGKGNVYLHLSPLAFSNYFLLKNNNIRYFESALSVIPSTTKRVVWDEYFSNPVQQFNRENEEQPKGSFFDELFKYRQLKYALLIAMLALLLYVLSEMRRKQRPIPPYAKPRNDSLEFVKTIGRLYFDRGDHKNLSRKMGTYFLEHVRSKYKIPTSVLDEDFIHRLKFKSGADRQSLTDIVGFIQTLEPRKSVSNAELANFHQLLNEFYNREKQPGTF